MQKEQVDTPPPGREEPGSLMTTLTPPFDTVLEVQKGIIDLNLIFNRIDKEILNGKIS